MFKSDNVYGTYSKSGKLTKETVRDWLHYVYFSNLQDESVLILDSWGGQNENYLLITLPERKKLEILVVPKGTTGFVQPLDVYGFRIWKCFVRFFDVLVILPRILHDLDVNRHLRDNILRLQTFTHNRHHLASVTCGSTAGLRRVSSKRPPKTANPVSFAFRNSDVADECLKCDDVPMITWAWCKIVCASGIFFFTIFTSVMSLWSKLGTLPTVNICKFCRHCK